MNPTPKNKIHSLLPPIVAGFIAVLVGFTSSAVLVFQAATSVGATPEETSSWFFALCLGMAITGIGFSIHYKKPVITAWTTPGSALLITALPGMSLSDATGAFLISGVLITLFGLTGWFEKLMKKIPISIASAMLGGILLRFGVDVFVAMKTEVYLVLIMFITYIAMKRFNPRYAVIGVLFIGVSIALSKGLLKTEDLKLQLASPIFIIPTFSITATLGVALPLFIVTMASQNIPGIAVMRASGYHTPISPLISGTGAVSALLSPFGSFGVTLAAITAAICMGKEAHEDPEKRYIAGISAGFFYLIVGLFSSTVAILFAAFPKELILALAGIALFGTIGNALKLATENENEREAALIAFLITASGILFHGIGSAFWGLVGGGTTLLFLRKR